MKHTPTLLEDISTLGRKMRTAFDAAVREKGLSLARARLLAKLTTSDAGKTQKQLAEELEIEAATLVGLLDGLEQSGAIIRAAVDGDRRAKRVELTEEGREQAGIVTGIIAAFRKDVFKGIEPDELETVRRVILQMQANLEARS